MINCQSCGNQNEADSKFCRFCGHALIPEVPESIFSGISLPAEHQDKGIVNNGYFIIALQSFANAILWFLYDLYKHGEYADTRDIYRIANWISTFIFVGQLLVMIIYTKNRNLKIMIIIMSVLITIYNIYWMVQTFYSS